MLSEIRTYLTERGRAPLSDIALRLGVSTDAARGGLEHWIRKGKVCRLVSCGGCSHSCGNCSHSAASEIYEWQS